MLKSTCATKCSILHKRILIAQPRQPAQLPSISCCLAWCGSAAPEARLCHSAAQPQIGRSTTATYLTVGSRGGIYTSSLPSQWSSSSVDHSVRPEQLLAHSLSSPLVTLSSQAFLCDFSINPWEKRLQNSIREQIHWFPKPKSTWFTF